METNNWYKTARLIRATCFGYHLCNIFLHRKWCFILVFFKKKQRSQSRHKTRHIKNKATLFAVIWNRKLFLILPLLRYLVYIFPSFESNSFLKKRTLSNFTRLLIVLENSSAFTKSSAFIYIILLHHAFYMRKIRCLSTMYCIALVNVLILVYLNMYLILLNLHIRMIILKFSF